MDNGADTSGDVMYAGGMTLAEKVGQMIRQRRTTWPGGMTLKQLSQLTGIGLSTLSEYECGRYTPSLEATVKIADVLYLDLNALTREALPRAS